MNIQIKLVRSGRAPGTGASVLMELGCVALPRYMCSPTWKLVEPCPLGLYKGLLT